MAEDGWTCAEITKHPFICGEAINDTYFNSPDGVSPLDVCCACGNGTSHS